MMLDVVALTLGFSGITKALNIRAFREGLLHVPFMRISWSYMIGYSLPFLEIALAAGLYANLILAKLVAILLLLSFSSLALLVIAKELDVPCNCFGPVENRLLSYKTIATNLFLITLVVLSLSLAGRRTWVLSPLTAATLLLTSLGFIELRKNAQIANELATGANP